MYILFNDTDTPISMLGVYLLLEKNENNFFFIFYEIHAFFLFHIKKKMFYVQNCGLICIYVNVFFSLYTCI